MLRTLQRNIRSIFSSVNILLLLFQSFMPGFLLLLPARAYAVEKQETGKVDLEFSQKSNEFELAVVANRDIEYELNYIVSADNESKRGAKGVASLTDGVAQATIYAGTCSTESECVADTVVSGSLTLPKAQYSTDFVVDGDVVWFQSGSTALVPTVELGTIYRAPQNNEVQVVFTRLPENPGSLSIEEIILTDEQVAVLGAYSNVAYDITSDMPNGSFEYELKLPLPEGADETAQVVYAENVGALLSQEIGVVETEKVAVDSEEGAVVVSELDHFTVFVVVPDDILPSNPTSATDLFDTGWRMTTVNDDPNNAQVALVAVADHAVPANFGPHSIRMNRAGGADEGTNRSFLGYFPDWSEGAPLLSSLEEVSWNRYTITGADTYLNIFIETGTFGDPGYRFATVVYAPTVNSGNWEKTTLDSSVTNSIRVRVFGPLGNFITENSVDSYANLISEYGDWRLRQHCHAGFVDCLGSIVIVSGSSSPTAAQEHYYDGVTIKFTGEEELYFDFVNEVPPTLSAPINLGWNLRSQSAAPGERPVDVVCGEATNGDYPIYSNGQIAHNWETSDIVVGLKFQRQWQWPGSGTWTTDSTAYSATNTPFATFGSAAGTEGTWNTRVRSWLDQNANNTFDEGTDLVSDWSNECSVTYDRTAPSIPTNGYPHNIILNSNVFDYTWDPSTDNLSGSVTYEYQASQNPAQTDGVLTSGLWQSWVHGNASQHPLTSPLIPSVGTSDGTWHWQVRTVDEAGNKSGWSEIWSYTLDSQAPTAPTIIKPEAEQYFKSTPILNQWTAAVDTGTGINRYQVAYLYDDLHTFGGSTCQGEEIGGQLLSGCRDENGLTRNHVPALTEQGGVTIWVRAIDNAGNVGPWSGPIHYYYDATTPLTDLITPVNNSFWNQPINISGQTTDNIGVAKVFIDYSIAGENDWQPITTLENGALNSPFNWNYNWTPSTEEQYDIRVRAEDAAGNLEATDYAYDIIYDVTNPVVAITSHSEGDIISGGVLFTGEITELHLSNYNLALYPDGANVWDFNQRIWQANVTNPPVPVGDVTTISHAFDTTTLSDGYYLLRLAARDKAGNRDPLANSGTGVSVQVIRIMVDNTAPSSEITTFDLENGGETLVTEFDGLIEGKATDNLSGVKEVLLEIAHTPFGSESAQYWNGSDWHDEPTQFPVAVAPEGDTNTTWFYQIAPEAKVLEGIYTVTSHAVDMAGNVEETYTITIVYDKTIPEVTLVIDPTAPNGKRGWYTVEPTITLTANDNYNVAEIQYRWNSGSWITYTVPIKPPSQGQNILSYRSIDSLGHVSVEGIKEVKFDQENPTEAFNMNASISGKNAKITWNEASDNVFVYAYIVTARNEALDIEQSETVPSDKREYEFTDLEDGEWVFSLRTEDIAGNNGSVARKSGTVGSSGSVAGAIQEIAANLLTGVSNVLGTANAQSADQGSQAEDDSEALELNSDDAENTDVAGSVLGESDDQCATWKFYLPLFLLLIQVLLAVSLEIANRDPGMRKLLTALAISGLMIVGFYILRDPNCYGDTTGFMQALAQWFIPVSVLLGFVLRGIGSVTVEEK